MVEPLISYVVCKIVTFRELILSNEQLEVKMGLTSQYTAQAAYQFFENKFLCSE